MPKISERSWKQTLSSILEELNKTQYKKLLMLLEIKGSLRRKPMEEMPEIIIQHFGLKKSIIKIIEIMEKIPRRDEAIQRLLRPYKDKLRARKRKGEFSAHRTNTILHLMRK